MAKAKKAAQAPATQAPVEAQEAKLAPAADAQTKTSLEPVQLTIADLQLLGRIIDLASRRGAFQAGELSQVGDAFNKLSGFLSYVESVQSTDAATESAESAPAPVAEAQVETEEAAAQ